MQSLKELIEGAFFHSWQRTAMVLGGLVLALALPITIILTQQQQDLRQRASGYTCGTGYPQQDGNCPDGWDCQQVTQSNNPFYNRWQCVERNPAPGTLPADPPTATPTTSPPSENPFELPNTTDTDYSTIHYVSCTNGKEFTDQVRIIANYVDDTGKACNGFPLATNYFQTGDFSWSIPSETNDYYNINCKPTKIAYYYVGIPSNAVYTPISLENANGSTIVNSSDGQHKVVLIPFSYIRSTVTESNPIKVKINAPDLACAGGGTGGNQTPPNCTTVEICDQTTCEAPINTCGDSNGTMSCKYYSHPTAGNNCTPAAAPNKSCGAFNCVGDAVCSNGQCVAPSATPTSTPTNTPTLTPTNTPTLTPTPTTPVAVVDTSPSPSLTQTPPDETLIALTVSLPGIGSNSPVEGLGTLSNNETPKRTTREVEVLLGNSEGTNVTSLASGSLTPVSGTLTFDPASFMYKGVINLGNLPTANYQVFVRLDNTLYRAATGYPLLTLGQTTAIPDIALISGDIDRTNSSDDNMTIDDYNLFIACFKEKEICTPQAKTRADLDDNEIIDTIDLHLMQRGFANRKGDSPI